MSPHTRAIGVFMLLVLIGLPAGTTVCDVLCRMGPLRAAQTSVPGTHHHDSHSEHQLAQSVGGRHVQGLSTGDCSGHTAAVREEVGVAAVRGDWNLGASMVGDSIAPTALTAITPFDATTAYSPPNGTAPETSTPLVLRV